MKWYIKVRQKGNKNKTCSPKTFTLPLSKMENKYRLLPLLWPPPTPTPQNNLCTVPQQHKCAGCESTVFTFTSVLFCTSRMCFESNVWGKFCGASVSNMYQNISQRFQIKCFLLIDGRVFICPLASVSAWGTFIPSSSLKSITSSDVHTNISGSPLLALWPSPTWELCWSK